MKDDLETECMNELFGVNKVIKAEIYTKSDKEQDYTSLVVAKGKNIYFKDVLNTPEITAIQRGVSFVKHSLDVDITEIYPDKVKAEEIKKDVFINWCKVGAIIGERPNEYARNLCNSELQIHERWNFTRGKGERE